MVLGALTLRFVGVGLRSVDSRSPSPMTPRIFALEVAASFFGIGRFFLLGAYSSSLLSSSESAVLPFLALASALDASVLPLIFLA